MLPVQQDTKTSSRSEQAEKEALNILDEAKWTKDTTSDPDWFIQGKCKKYDPAIFHPKEDAWAYTVDDIHFINRDDIGLLKKIALPKPSFSSRENMKEILSKTSAVKKRRWSCYFSH